MLRSKEEEFEPTSGIEAVISKPKWCYCGANSKIASLRRMLLVAMLPKNRRILIRWSLVGRRFRGGWSFLKWRIDPFVLSEKMTCRL